VTWEFTHIVVVYNAIIVVYMNDFILNLDGQYMD